MNKITLSMTAAVRSAARLLGRLREAASCWYSRCDWCGTDSVACDGLPTDGAIAQGWSLMEVSIGSFRMACRSCTPQMRVCFICQRYSCHLSHLDVNGFVMGRLVDGTSSRTTVACAICSETYKMRSETGPAIRHELARIFSYPVLVVLVGADKVGVLMQTDRGSSRFFMIEGRSAFLDALRSEPDGSCRLPTLGKLPCQCSSRDLLAETTSH